LNSADAFPSRLAHVPDGIVFLQKGNVILVFFLLWVGRFL